MRALPKLAAVLVAVALTGAAAVIAEAPTICAAFLEQRGTAQLGRKLEIAGVAIEWGRRIIVTATGIRAANAASAASPDLFTAGRIVLGIDAASLLLLHPRVRSLLVEDAALLLEVSPSGALSWAPPDGAARAASDAFARVEDVTLRGMTVEGRDQRSGENHAARFDELHAAATASRPYAVSASGAVDGRDFALDGSIDPLGAAGPYRVTLGGRFGTSHLALDGAVAKPLTFRGVNAELTLEGPDLRELAPRPGIAGSAALPYAAKARLAEKDGVWRLDDLDLRLGESRLAGRLALDATRARPHLTGRLDAPFLDLGEIERLRAEAAAHAAPSSAPHRPGDRVLPDPALPPAIIAPFDADLDVSARAVRMEPGPVLHNLAFELALAAGRMEVRGLKAQLSKGELTLDLVLDGNARAVSRLDLGLRGVSVRPLLEAFAVGPRYRTIAGVLDASARLTSHGGSLRQLLAGASGGISILARDGEVGHDLARLVGLQLLKVGNAQPKPQAIDCLRGEFAVKEGVATATFLVLDTPDALVEGAGNVNLGDETFQLDFTPYPKRSASPRVSASMALRGTFSKLEAHPDRVEAGANAITALAEKLLPGGIAANLESSAARAGACRAGAPPAARRP